PDTHQSLFSPTRDVANGLERTRTLYSDENYRFHGDDVGIQGDCRTRSQRTRPVEGNVPASVCRRKAETCQRKSESYGKRFSIEWPGYSATEGFLHCRRYRTQ